MSSRARRLAVAAALLLAPVAGSRLRAQEISCDRGDTEVRGLEFTGNKAFRDAQLAAAVVTTPSSVVYRTPLLRWPPLKWFGQRRCIQLTEIVLDRARLILFYRNRGYPDVAVDTTVTRDGRAIRVRFAIREGRAIRVDTVAVSWIDTMPGAARIVRGLPVRVGDAFNKVAIEAARDTMLARLGNAGYPWAQVLANYETSRDQYTARVGFDVLPGTRARLGTIEIDADARQAGRGQQIPDDVARRLTGLREGAVYRDRDVAAARRNLYQTEAYQNVAITRDTAPGADSLVNLRVRLSEGFMRAARLSGGYGTIDCFRGQGDLSHRNVRVAGLATRLDLTARVSKIGRGAPLGNRDLGGTLCPQVTNGDDLDPYSDNLNYYGGVTLRQPVFAGVSIFLPSITLYSQQASEYKAFLRTVPAGAVANYNWTPRPTLPQTFSYSIEKGRTTAAPAVFCAAFNACQDADREQLQRLQRAATLGWSITRNRANDAVDPSAGSVARLDVRHASTLIGSSQTVQFNKAVGDVSRYVPVAGNVLALRVRAGGVFGGRLNFSNGEIPNYIPQQERLFAGGAQTVRGFRQNELGPQVYVLGSPAFDAVPAVVDGAPVVDPVSQRPVYYLRLQDTARVQPRVVPLGGNTLLVGNAEFRFRTPLLPELLQFVAFVDVGNVWNRNAGSRAAENAVQLFATPGAGVRVASPFGPIRVDVGYNRYAPTAGALYYEATETEGGELLCVSPGNTVEVVNQGSDAAPRWQPLDPTQRCSAGYAPDRRRGLRRLNISLSIAQAF